MNSVRNDAGLPAPGFPIRKSPDQSLLSGSPKLIAASHVLHRLLAPRHPPCALSSLTTLRRCHQMRFHKIRLPVCNCQRTLRLRRIRHCGLDPRCSTHDRARRASNTHGSGADRDRTDDLRLARAALSHLSYSPAAASDASPSAARTSMVGLGRVELPTSPLSGVRSSQLSYRPGQCAGPSKLDGSACDDRDDRLQ